MSPTFRQLVPPPQLQPDNPDTVHSQAPQVEGRPVLDERPWVYTNMISTLDGGIAIDGVSGGLGGPADREMFSVLRASADAIIVGATTANDEGYRRPRTPAALTTARGRLGRDRPPLLVVISGSLSVDPELPALTDEGDDAPRPIVVGSTSADPERQRALGERCELLLHEPRVDLVRLLAQLKDRGVDTAVLEGGPGLNGGFVSLGLIDEWNLTLSPLLISGTSPRAAHGAASPDPERRLELCRLWLGDDLLFGRWRRHVA